MGALGKEHKISLPKAKGVMKRSFYTIEPPASDPDKSVLVVMMSDTDLEAAKKEFPGLTIRESTPEEIADCVNANGMCGEA